MRALLLLIFLIISVLGAPRLDLYMDIGGVRFYADSNDSSLWYAAPTAPRIAQENGEPAYRLDLFRYLGRSGTGDKNLFWARGVLTLRITRAPLPPDARKRLAENLKTIAKPKIVSSPVEHALITVMFGDINVTKEDEGRWSESTITIGLDAMMAQLLWKATEAGQTHISVVTTETIPGVIKGKEGWKEGRTEITYTIPVILDIQQYPHRFSKVDMGGRMKRGYTQLDVFDFNFVDNLKPGLYKEEVEIAIPTEGRPLVKKAVFKKGGDVRQRIRFHLSKNLNTPYRFRIIEIYKDGTVIKNPWRRKKGETLLDITQYAERSES